MKKSDSSTFTGGMQLPLPEELRLKKYNTIKKIKRYNNKIIQLTDEFDKEIAEQEYRFVELVNKIYSICEEIRERRRIHCEIKESGLDQLKRMERELLLIKDTIPNTTIFVDEIDAHITDIDNTITKTYIKTIKDLHSFEKGFSKECNEMVGTIDKYISEG